VEAARSIEDYTGYTDVKSGLLTKLQYVRLDPCS
jgi:hypothetical protein